MPQFVRRCIETIAAAALFSPAIANAQSAVTAGAVRVIVRMPEVDDGSAAITVTRKAGEGYMVHVPRRAATPTNLHQALRTVYQLLEGDGDSLRNDEVIFVPKGVAQPQGSDARHSVFAELMRAKPVVSKGVSARVVSIYVPRATERANARPSKGNPQH